MSKELTLEQLAASTQVSKPTDSKQPAAVQKKRARYHEDPSNGAVKVTPDQIVGQLIKSGAIKEPEKKVAEDSPIVKNAFEAMDRTLQERKDRIEKAKPFIYENARQIALENEAKELGINDDEASNENETSDTVVDDTSETLDEEESNMMNDIDLDKEIESIEKTTSESDEGYVEDLSKKTYRFEGDNEEMEETEVTTTEPKVEEEIHTDIVEEPKEVSVEETPVNDKPVEETPTVPATPKEPQDDISQLDDLLESLDADNNLDEMESIEEETPEEIRARFKKTFESVTITSDPIDFRKFKIRSKPVASSYILNKLGNNRSLKKADWALYFTGKPVTFIESGGPELDNLRKTMSASNNINGVIASLRFIYSHIEDANKPIFETWTKLIRTEDIESLYYGLYRACYSSTNLIARVCTNDKCKKTSLIDTDINAMVKYGEDGDNSEEIKARFNAIMNKDTTTASHAFDSTLMQISNDVVISYSPATLYTTFIQLATLDNKITTKFSDILNMMAYIDGFFTIDRETSELVPVEIKEYPKNLNKTVLSRLKVFTEILKTLSNDQYNVVTGKLNNLIQRPKINYVFPAVECPECHKTIEESPIDSMLSLLFMRAQLAQVRSLSER